MRLMPILIAATVLSVAPAKILPGAASATARATAAARGPMLPTGQVLPTGQILTATAAPGARFDPLVAHAGPDPSYVADGAAAIAVSPDGREMLVLTSGFNRTVGANGKVVPAQSGQYVLRFAIDRAGSRWLQTLIVPNSYSGIAWRPDNAGFIVGGGVDDVIHVFARGGGGAFAEAAPIKLGHAAGVGADVKPQAAGVAISPDGGHALVANYYNDSVSLIDLRTGSVIAEQDLRPGKIDPAQAGVAGGENPFAIVWRDAGHAYVSAPRDRQIVALSIGDTAHPIRVATRIATIGEPTALLYDAARHQLLATEDNADRLALVDSASDRVVAEPRVGFPEALTAVPGGKGVNPDALSMLPDGRLLVTFGGVNAVAIVARSAHGAAVEGLVPTGWYPSAVATSRDGGRVFVANRKSPPGPNPQGCAPRSSVQKAQPDACGAANQYIYQLEKAGLLQFPLPGPHALVATTRQVARNVGADDGRVRAAAAAVLARVHSKIAHVIFIVKENRTYDQLLGDLDRGNGDPSLAILGAAFSPNHHALARQFVTLDNFYDSGEQSSTGWTWTTAGRVPDLLEKTAPVNYAQRGLGYEAEEADRFIYTALDPAARHVANPKTSTDPDILPGAALLTAPDPDDDAAPGQGFLWDAAIKAGLSVRNYGFSDASVYDAGEPGAVPLIRDPAREHIRIYTPGDRLLASRSDPYFRGFDQKMPDYWRMLEWQREFDAADAAGTLPALTLLRLSHDHFGDFGSAIDGVDTVETEMADNDYALGRVVERVAASKSAGSTLIFVIEDDAQNGADHVDARRSVAFVVGATVRQNALVSTRYTTISLLRTIEAVLGLRPMGLNDALAVPMADVFDPAQTRWSFHATAADILKTTKLPIKADRFAAQIDGAGRAVAAAQINGAGRAVAAAQIGGAGRAVAVGAPPCATRNAAWWSAAMRGQDFRHEDRLDTAAFNHALWAGLGHGPEPVVRSGADLRERRPTGIASCR